jgi:hypothetical protein
MGWKLFKSKEKPAPAKEPLPAPSQGGLSVDFCPRCKKMYQSEHGPGSHRNKCPHCGKETTSTTIGRTIITTGKPDGKPAQEETRASAVPLPTAAEMISILKDFDLSPKDILASLEKSGEKEIETTETPVAFLLRTFNIVYGDNHKEMLQNISGVLHDVLVFSWRGFEDQLNYEDQGMLEVNLKPMLKRFGIEVDFVNANWDEQDFDIVVGKGAETGKAHHHGNEPGMMDFAGMLGVLNGLIGRYGLEYVELESGGDCLHCYLFEKDQPQKLKEKYGALFDKIVAP